MTVDLVVLNAHPSDLPAGASATASAAAVSRLRRGLGLATGPAGCSSAGATFCARRSCSCCARRPGFTCPCDGRPLGRILVDRGPAAEERDRDGDGDQPPRSARERLHGRPWCDRLRVPAPAAGDCRCRRVRPLRPGRRRRRSPPALRQRLRGSRRRRRLPDRVAGRPAAPAPWANVIANPRGGFLVTERGAGFTWAESSYFFRLTPWHNDPVSDPVSEASTCGTRRPARLERHAGAGPRRCGLHRVGTAPGSSTFQHEHGGIATRPHARAWPTARPVKLSLLRLTNDGPAPPTVIVTAYVEWTLGVQREHTQHQVRTELRCRPGRRLRPEHLRPPVRRLVRLLRDERAGHERTRRRPAGVPGPQRQRRRLRRGLAGRPLAGTHRAALDPCAACSARSSSAPGEIRGDRRPPRRAPTARPRRETLVDTAPEPGRRHRCEQQTVARWERAALASSRCARRSRPSTPCSTAGRSTRRWPAGCGPAPRSTRAAAPTASATSCRMSMALVYAEPALAAGTSPARRGPAVRRGRRAALVASAERPRRAHPLLRRPRLAAVRRGPLRARHRRCLGARRAGAVPQHAPARARTSTRSTTCPRSPAEEGTLYEHCLRALRRACDPRRARPAAHRQRRLERRDEPGGRGGQGGERLAGVVPGDDAPGLRPSRGGPRRRRRGGLDAAPAPTATSRRVETHGWDGAWYRRAYFDDGTPLGSAASEECRIDSIAQSWSVISGAGRPDRAAPGDGFPARSILVDAATRA